MTEKRSFLGTLSTFIAFVTGLVSFAANIATVASSLGAPQIQIKGIEIGNSLRWHNVAIFADSTFALTTAIYTCLVFIFVGFRSSTLAGLRILVIVPPLLLSLWSVAYLQNNPWWCISAIILSQFWITLLLPSFHDPANCNPAHPISIGILYPLFVFATTAAALRYLQFGSGIWSWLSAGTVALSTFIFIIWRTNKIEEDYTCRRTAFEETLSRRQCDMAENIYTILKEYTHQRNFFLTPNIPPIMLANARTCCVIPSSEVVVGLIDCTVFGSAKKAIVFTGKGVYYCTSSTTGYIKYFGFPELEFVPSKSGITISGNAINGTQFLDNGSAFSNLALFEILQAIKRLVARL